MRGRLGMSASPMPAITRRIEGAVLNRRATTAATISTAISSRRVWIVAVTGYLILNVIARGCTRFRAHASITQAKVFSLIEARAFVDATCALQKLETPQRSSPHRL